MIRAFKGSCTTRIRQSTSKDFAWLRGYHDRIIRDQKELELIQRYIQNNPSTWAEDMFNQ